MVFAATGAEFERGTLQELVDALPDDFPKNPRTVRRDLIRMSL
jgi:hypothetical protein